MQIRTGNVQRNIRRINSVSYTHLDVYKRQVTDNVKTIRSIPLVLHGDNYPASFEIRGEILMPWEVFEDVSYTHLDVYKRQALMFIIHTAAIMLHSVADNQVIYFQYHIISGNLIENSLRYFRCV